jgi:hypothetical protein
MMNRRKLLTIVLMPVALSGLLLFLIQITAVSGGVGESHAIAPPGESLLRVVNEVEPNDIPAQANPIDVDLPMAGAIPISQPADIDWYRLALSGGDIGRDFSATLEEVVPDADYRLQLNLYDSEVNLITSVSSPSTSSLDWTSTVITYYLRVRAVEFDVVTAPGDADYELTVLHLAVPWDDCEINDARDGAWSPTTPPGGPCVLSMGIRKTGLNFLPHGSIPPAVPNDDYFLFLAREGHTYRIMTYVQGGTDTEMWLYKPDGTEIYDDNGGEDFGSRIEATLSGGRHIILVRDRRQSTSPPTYQTYDILVEDLTPAILHVKPSASGDASCSDWDSACTLQTALGVAAPGDEIWVVQGVHKPGVDRGDTFQLKSGVAVYGGFAATETSREERDWETHVTVLSGDIDGNDLTDPHGVLTTTAHISGSNSYHVVTGSGVDATAVVDGFTITGGDADSYPVSVCGSACGGGMYNDGSNPTLANIIFSANAAYFGGGMYNRYGSSPALTNVTFSGNSADYGGGMCNSYSSSPALTGVTFSGNFAYLGGGMYNSNSSPALANVTFSSNSAEYGGGMDNLNSSSPALINVTFSDNSAYLGGGMYNSNSSSPVLTDVTFSGNSADAGGGMFNSSHLVLANVTFSGNSAIVDRGGMYSSNSGPALSNVIFSGNSAITGGGMYNSSGLVLANVTFSGNSAVGGGGGLFNHSTSATLANCILWGNTDGGTDEREAQIFNTSSTITVSYSLVGGGVYTGTGNISADPLFMRDPDSGDGDWTTPEDNDYGDLRLQHTSPAIDAGDNTAVPPGVTTDRDGEPRFADIPSRPDTGVGPAPIVDMGAYEAQMNIYLPLVQRNY